MVDEGGHYQIIKRMPVPVDVHAQDEYDEEVDHEPDGEDVVPSGRGFHSVEESLVVAILLT